MKGKDKQIPGERKGPLFPRARSRTQIPFPLFFERLPHTLIYSRPLLNIIYFSFYSFFLLAFPRLSLKIKFYKITLNTNFKPKRFNGQVFKDAKCYVCSLDRLKQSSKTSKQKNLQPTEISNVNHYHRQHPCNNLRASCPFKDIGRSHAQAASGKRRVTEDRPPRAGWLLTRAFSRDRLK